ncbi:MAG: ankyrin repeat domain-containing protein [Sphingomonadales bacterium]|nr:ankyrin repeat domain-containing protein [Sphingomonadales bacterium]
MMVNRFCTLVLMAGALAVAFAGPAAAQFSDTWEFMEAVEKRDYREMRSRLFKGANINARNSDGLPSIVVAAEAGDLELARFLVGQGANVNATTEGRGETAVMRAAELGRDAMLRYLLENGADFDREDRGGETPLMKAAKARQEDAAEILIEAGADALLEDYTGRTALQFAEEARARGIIRLLEGLGAAN